MLAAIQLIVTAKSVGRLILPFPAYSSLLAYTSKSSNLLIESQHKMKAVLPSINSFLGKFFIDVRIIKI